MPIVHKRCTEFLACRRSDIRQQGEKSTEAMFELFVAPLKTRMTDLFQLLKRRWLPGAMLASCLAGCSHQHAFVDSTKQTRIADREMLKQVSYEEVAKPANEQPGCVEPAPFNLDTDSATVQYWDLTLDGAIQTALANSTV